MLICICVYLIPAWWGTNHYPYFMLRWISQGYRVRKGQSWDVSPGLFSFQSLCQQSMIQTQGFWIYASPEGTLIVSPFHALLSCNSHLTVLVKTRHPWYTRIHAFQGQHFLVTVLHTCSSPWLHFCPSHQEFLNNSWKENQNVHLPSLKHTGASKGNEWPHELILIRKGYPGGPFGPYRFKACQGKWGAAFP